MIAQNFAQRMLKATRRNMRTAVLFDLHFALQDDERPYARNCKRVNKDEYYYPFSGLLNEIFGEDRILGPLG
jgi:hypothetical protein